MRVLSINVSSLLCRAKVLGEYSHLKAELEPAVVQALLAKLLDMKHTSSETKSWVFMALTKLCARGAGGQVTQQLSETYSSSMDTVLRQRAQELQHLSRDPELHAKVLPVDGDLEPLEVTCHQDHTALKMFAKFVTSKHFGYLYHV